MEDEDSNSNQANLLDCLVQAQNYAFHQVGPFISYPKENHKTCVLFQDLIP